MHARQTTSKMHRYILYPPQQDPGIHELLLLNHRPWVPPIETSNMEWHDNIDIVKRFAGLHIDTPAPCPTPPAEPGQEWEQEHRPIHGRSNPFSDAEERQLLEGLGLFKKEIEELKSYAKILAAMCDAFQRLRKILVEPDNGQWSIIEQTQAAMKMQDKVNAEAEGDLRIFEGALARLGLMNPSSDHAPKEVETVAAGSPMSMRVCGSEGGGGLDQDGDDSNHRDGNEGRDAHAKDEGQHQLNKWEAPLPSRPLADDANTGSNQYTRKLRKCHRRKSSPGHDRCQRLHDH